MTLIRRIITGLPPCFKLLIAGSSCNFSVTSYKRCLSIYLSVYLSMRQSHALFLYISTLSPQHWVTIFLFIMKQQTCFSATKAKEWCPPCVSGDLPSFQSRWPRASVFPYVFPSVKERKKEAMGASVFHGKHICWSSGPTVVGLMAGKGIKTAIIKDEWTEQENGTSENNTGKKGRQR